MNYINQLIINNKNNVIKVLRRDPDPFEQSNNIIIHAVS